MRCLPTLSPSSEDNACPDALLGRCLSWYWCKDSSKQMSIAATGDRARPPLLRWASERCSACAEAVLCAISQNRSTTLAKFQACLAASNALRKRISVTTKTSESVLVP